METAYAKYNLSTFKSFEAEACGQTH